MPTQVDCSRPFGRLPRKSNKPNEPLSSTLSSTRPPDYVFVTPVEVDADGGYVTHDPEGPPASQDQEVRGSASSLDSRPLPAGRLRPGHAPGPAAVARGRPGLHRADAGRRRHRHDNGGGGC